MTDCSFNNFCKQGVCYLDEGKCKNINPDALTIYVNKKPFTGSPEAIQGYLMSYFSELERIKCNTGADIVGALPGDDAWADFSDKNLNEIRRALSGEDIIGFYNLENKKIICEVASTLFRFWNTKKGQARGIIVTPPQVEKIKQEYVQKVNSGETPEEARWQLLRMV